MCAPQVPRLLGGSTSFVSHRPCPSPPCSPSLLVPPFLTPNPPASLAARAPSGDNKGAAEHFTEKWAAGREDMAPGFVAAFAQNNGADTTPNTYGAFCLDSGGSERLGPPAPK
jgi:hypothetical protein